MKGETFLSEYEQHLAGEEAEMSQDEGMLPLFREKWVGSAPLVCVCGGRGWSATCLRLWSELAALMGGGQVSSRVLAWSPDGAEGCRTSLGYLGWWSTD